MVICKPGPKWLSWSLRTPHLPAEFHRSTQAFESFIKWLHKMPYCTTAMDVYDQSRVMMVCLGIGLVLRDLHECQVASAHKDAQIANSPLLPKPLQESKLTWAHSQALLQVCIDIEKHLSICMGAESPETENPVSEPAPKKRKKGPVPVQPAM